MPVIDLPLNRINKLLEKSVTLDELEEYCLQLGLDVEDKNDEKIKVEYNPNRPDFSSIAGITRALNGLLGLETGIPKYSLKKSGIKVLVEESIKGIRGHIQCAIIRDVQLTEDRIAELMNIQEALHWVIGRDRKKVSIGIHDMANITPPFRYFGAKATEHPFIPLTSEKKMTPKEICMEHPKGKKYVHLVDPDGLVPLLVDKNDGVLSFPPIINGVLTQVNQNTKDIFIDVTGPEEQAVRYCLEILASSFAEEGKTVESVKIVDTSAEIIKETPTFALQEKTVKAKYVKDILGLNLKKAEIKTYLEKARLNVLPYKKGARTLTVEIPSFRTDILHEIDLVEEVAITYGYHNLEPVLDNFVTIGQEHPIVKLQNKCREIMSGLGFLEIFNFTLVSRDWQYDKMRTKGNPVVLLNPVSKEYNIVRDSLLPGLLKVLEENKPYPLPQKIFDTGDVCLVDKNQETKVKREIFLSGASIHSKADFVEIKSIVVAILDALGIKEYHFQETEHPSFFSGRCANVFVNDEIVGIFGEIHPLVLENFDLENPVGAFELKVEKIIN